MRRLFAAALALMLLLSGCAEAEPTSPLPVLALDAPADFGSFTAQPPGETEEARAVLTSALALYPPGLPERLNARILLCSGLTGRDDFTHGSYAGFTISTEEGWQIVLDTDAFDAGTVHHEIAHVLDSILTDAGLLTEETWLELCPSGFSWGDRNWEDYPDFFVDAYAMQNIREDRARTFEEAMLRGSGVYEGRPALWLKLEYLSGAIRSHFATPHWPAETPWEAALD